MSSPLTTTTFHQQPTFNFIPVSSSSLSSSLRLFPLSNPSFRVKTRLFCRIVSNRVLRSIIMTKMVRGSGFGAGGGVAASGSRCGNDDEGVGALEQEGFVDGSVTFVANGLESFMNRLSKWLIAGLFGVFILWRHDAEVLWATMGSVLNVCLSVTLKKILNQERPFSTVKSGPGMPSSHAQSIFYATFFVILSMVKAQGVNALTFIIGGLILALGSYLTWLRVSQRLHSRNQVIVGATVGMLFSTMWFWSWDVFVLEAFVSFLWVRILLVLCALVSTLGFVFHVIQNWFQA